MAKFLLFCLLYVQAMEAQDHSVEVHSHNDYAQKVPFHEAYTSKAGSIEVDVFLKRDTLFVTHSEAEIMSGRSLEELYLKPLRKEIAKNKQGSQRLQLLIDVKSEGRTTLKSIMSVLQQFEDLVKNPEISFVISGNRPPAAEYVSYPDHILFDYQSLDDLKDQKKWEKVALISLPFYKYSDWKGVDELPGAERSNIGDIVARAHAYGRPFRFWATPDTQLAWKTFARLGIDYINTDRPSECAKYIAQQKKGIINNAPFMIFYEMIIRNLP